MSLLCMRIPFLALSRGEKRREKVTPAVGHKNQENVSFFFLREEVKKKQCGILLVCLSLFLFFHVWKKKRVKKIPPCRL